MNDRFKYRCWDKQIKKMRYGDIQLSCSGLPFTLEATSEGLKVVDIDNIEIMQCTGLKDKKSQLIYEGDIVKTKFVGRDIPEHKVNVADYDFFIVIFEKALFRLEKTNPDRWFSCFYIAGREQQFEVIGNIYENPELLEVNNASRNGLMRIK